MVQQQNKPTPRRQTIEQERGREAWDDIQAVKAIKGMAKDYRPIARGLNAMIQINGLGQALGFFYAKSIDEKTDLPSPNKAHYQMLSHLTNWMRGHFTPGASKIGEEYKGLLAWVLDKDTTSSDYRRATTECLAFGRWLARFAEAELADNTTSKESTTKETANG